MLKQCPQASRSESSSASSKRRNKAQIVAAANQTNDRPAVRDPLTPKTQDELRKTIQTRAWSVLPSCILALLRLNTHHQRQIAIGVVFAVAFALVVLLSSWANSNSLPAKKVKRWIVLASGTLVGCGLLWWFTVPAALTVTVTPPNISFKNQWDTYRFVVTNDLGSDAYEVVVKFAYGVPPSDFKFDLPTSESKTLGEDIHDNDKGLKHTDAIGMSCKTVHGTYDTFITFFNLTPKERRTINISRLKPGEIEVASRITYFSTESKEYKSGPHLTAQQSMSDEECTPIQLSFGLK